MWAVNHVFNMFFVKQLSSNKIINNPSDVVESLDSILLRAENVDEIIQIITFLKNKEKKNTLS